MTKPTGKTKQGASKQTKQGTGGAAAGKPRAKSAAAKPLAAKVPAKPPVGKTATKKPSTKRSAGGSGRGLTTRYGLLLDSRASFDRLSPADRAQLAVAGRLICGEADLDAAFAWFEREEMSLFKLHLYRGDAVEWDVWINTAMDDGAVFEPGTPKENGIGISQMNVHDMEDDRAPLCAEIDAALRGFKLPKGMVLEDVFWK